MIGISNAFFPFVGPPGLFISVDAGDVLYNGTVTRVPLTTVALTASATNYIYLVISTHTITKNTSGFPAADSFPIAVSTTDSQKVLTLVDSRSDTGIIGVAGGVNATSIQGTAVSAVAPTNGQVLTYVSANTDAEWQTPAGGGGVAVRVATTVLTNAQVLTLFSVPVAVSPQFSGTKIIVTGGALSFNAVGAYTNALANNLNLYHTDTLSTTTFSEMNALGFLSSATAKTVIIGGGDQINGNLDYSLLGLPAAPDQIFLQNNQGSEYTGGNASNTLTVSLTYYLFNPLTGAIS